MIKDQSANTSRTKTLTRLVELLNAPRVEEVEILASDVDADQKHEDLREAVTRDRIEPLIEWLRNILLYTHYKQNRRQLIGMVFTERLVNLILRDCVVFPQLNPVRPGLEPTVEWVPRLEMSDDQKLFIRWMQGVIHVFEKGWLWRLRRCAYEPCGLWFEAKDPRKQFDSLNCKNRAYAESLAGKKKKRRYMKLYMRTYRERAGI